MNYTQKVSDFVRLDVVNKVFVLTSHIYALIFDYFGMIDTPHIVFFT